MHLRYRWYEMRMRLHSKLDKRVMLLRTISGAGPVTDAAIVATVSDAKQFKNGRQFAAWLDLTPINLSISGKERLGRITKMGDPYIKRLLVTGMTSRLRQMKVNPDRVDPWAIGLLERKSAPLATFAMANRTARIVWAVLTHEMMSHLQSANKDTPSNVQETLLSDKLFGTWSREPSGPEAMSAAQTGRTHVCFWPVRNYFKNILLCRCYPQKT